MIEPLTLDLSFIQEGTLDLYWREPFLLFLCLIPWIILRSYRFNQEKYWLKIAEPRLWPWVKLSQHSGKLQHSALQIKSRLSFYLLWFFFCVAMAGPRTPEYIPPSLVEDKTAMMIIVDFSKSMQAIDDSYSGNTRIHQSQQFLMSWLETIPKKIKTGLLIFSGQPHLILIPTADHSLVYHHLSQLDKFSPPILGNRLAASINLAEKFLNRYGDFKKANDNLPLKEPLNKKSYRQIILLLTDGDIEKAEEKAALNVNKSTTELVIIGVGHKEAVNIPDDAYKPLKINGKVITTRLQEKILQAIAKAHNGKFLSLKQLQNDSSTLSKELDLSRTRVDPRDTDKVVWNELFYIPLLMGFIVVFFINLYFLFSAKILKASSLLMVFLVSILSLSSCGLSTQVKFEKLFYQGVSCYQSKDYHCALQIFSQLAWALEPSTSINKKQTKQAWNRTLHRQVVFNLANTHFKLGDYEQASVLFVEAELLGINADKTRLNKDFSDSLAISVRRHIDDINRTKQYANWLSSAYELPSGLQDRVASGVFFNRDENTKRYAKLSFSEKKRLIQRGVAQVLANQKGISVVNNNKTFWVHSESLNNKASKENQTANLINKLLPLESGLAYIPEKPIQLKGQRIW